MTADRANGWTTKDQTAELKVGDIVSINGNLVDSDKETVRFIITNANIGTLTVMVLMCSRASSLAPQYRGGFIKHPGDSWTFRRAQLIGKNWRKR